MRGIEDYCEKQLAEISKEEERQADIKRRQLAIKQRRNGIGNKDRALAFGNIKNNRHTKETGEARQWNSNCQVKKPLRMASVELNPVSRGPTSAAQCKPKAIISKPKRESASKKVVRNRLDLLNDIFGSFSYRTDSEDEYDSEY